MGTDQHRAHAAEEHRAGDSRDIGRRDVPEFAFHLQSIERSQKAVLRADIGFIGTDQIARIYGAVAPLTRGDARFTPLQTTRYTEPEPELSLLLKKLKLELPAQPPPKITASAPAPPTPM
jgi:hypothetical protein